MTRREAIRLANDHVGALYQNVLGAWCFQFSPSAEAHRTIYARPTYNQARTCRTEVRDKIAKAYQALDAMSKVGPEQ